MQRKELSEGESAAMRLALEERKRVQLEAQSKRNIEEEDRAMAKKAADEEADFFLRCEKDDSYARSLQDEQYAEQCQEYEEQQALMLRKRDLVSTAADKKVWELIINSCHCIDQILNDYYRLVSCRYQRHNYPISLFLS